MILSGYKIEDVISLYIYIYMCTNKYVCIYISTYTHMYTYTYRTHIDPLLIKIKLNVLWNSTNVLILNTHNVFVKTNIKTMCRKK